MKQSFWERRNNNGQGIIHNLRFWIVLLLILIATFIYYANLPISPFHWSWLWYVQVIEFNYDFYGSLYYIPLIYAVLCLWWKGAFGKNAAI